MKLQRSFTALLVFAAVVGLAYVGQKAAPAGVRMADAAQQFLDSLDADQKTKTTFAFDDKERTRWHFIPLQDSAKKSTRKGLPIEAMTADQKKRARALLATGTSIDGYERVTTIMSLEALLREMEKGGAMVRNPEWYFVTIFGTPSATSRWGWRFEGHHLSLNFTVEGGKVTSATPAFFGANPAIVKSGPRKGLRTLPECEDYAVELFQSLDDGQKKSAFQPRQFPEVVAQNAAPAVAVPVGLSADKMNDTQVTLLKKLLKSYADRMPADVGEAEWKQVQDAGIENVHFAYAGGTQPGQPHTYRLQGPTFVVEFLNIQADSAQNPANHIHSCWRTIKGDFGLSAR